MIQKIGNLSALESSKTLESKQQVRIRKLVDCSSPVQECAVCLFEKKKTNSVQCIVSGLEDKATACQMLVCYARELKEHFVDYAEQTVKLMVPMLKFYFHDGVRTAAAESLPCLLECAKIRGANYVQDMWSYICPELLKVHGFIMRT